MDPEAERCIEVEVASVEVEEGSSQVRGRWCGGWCRAKADFTSSEKDDVSHGDGGLEVASWVTLVLTQVTLAPLECWG
jgi:hypothetical protein